MFDLISYTVLLGIFVRMMWIGYLGLGVLGMLALILYERVNKVYMELFKEEAEEKVRSFVRQHYWKGQ